MLGKLAGPLMKVAVPLAKNVLAPLATVASASVIAGAFQRKLHERGMIATSRADVARTGKGIALVISIEDMYDIIRILK